MCTVSVKINEAVLREVLPELENSAAIRRWAQLLIDQHIDALTKEFAMQHDLTPEGLYGIIADDINAVYAADDHETVDLETARQMTLDVVREEYARP